MCRALQCHLFATKTKILQTIVHNTHRLFFCFFTKYLISVKSRWLLKLSTLTFTHPTTTKRNRNKKQESTQRQSWNIHSRTVSFFRSVVPFHTPGNVTTSARLASCVTPAATQPARVCIERKQEREGSRRRDVSTSRWIFWSEAHPGRLGFHKSGKSIQKTAA